LWLELPELRIIHAQWYQPWMAQLLPMLTPEHQLTDELLQQYAQKSTYPDTYAAVEGLLKGAEVDLEPFGLHFHDKEGKYRTQARINWWKLHRSVE
ncbi:hypothetical protein RZS08_60090, partial [Arthrospira platensis SPKY1]|nr:hypothetical protein [Arthrospira platensis SPKY1]